MVLIIQVLKVAEYHKKGIYLKPKNFGDAAKVSTSTCMVCLQDPKTYNKVKFLFVLLFNNFSVLFQIILLMI